MAITFVGSKTFTHAAITEQSCSLTDLKDEADANATLLENDYIIISYVIATAGVNRTAAQMRPTGYTSIMNDIYANDDYDTNMLVSYKKMGSTPDTTVGIPASDSTSNGVACTIYAFRGVDVLNPNDRPTGSGAVVTTGINTGVANCSSCEPNTPGAWIMAQGAAAVAAGAVFTNPSGMSTTTNHFRSATITSTTNQAVVGTALKTDWASGSFDPAAFGGSSSATTGSWAAATVVLKPQGIQAPLTVTTSILNFDRAEVTVGTVITPTTPTLTLTAFAPTVSTPRLATPTTATLVTTALAPSVTVDRTITPTTAIATTATYAPTVLTPRLVTPTTATLSISAFAPSVILGKTVTTATASLVATTFAPTIVTPVTVTPTTASLTNATFTPLIVTPRLTTPTTASLTLTTFAPVMQLAVIPTTAVRTLATFAPTVRTPVTITPSNKNLLLSSYVIQITTPVTVTPNATTVVLTTYTPAMGGVGWYYYLMSV